MFLQLCLGYWMFLQFCLGYWIIIRSLIYTANLFWVVSVLWICWMFMGALIFDFAFMFLKYVFFLCSSLMRFFVVQMFSFFRNVLGNFSHLDVFIVAPFISSTGLAIVAEADLLCVSYFPEKICRHKLVVFTSFWSWLLNVSSVLTSMELTAPFFGC